jgi:hypothetical protein
MNVARGLYNIMSVTLVAVFGIAVLKLLLSKWYIPGASDIIAIV